MSIRSEYTHFPQLETERLILRELEPGDAPAIFSIASDDEVMHFYDLDTFQFLEETSAFIERQRARYEREGGICWVSPNARAGQLSGGAVTWWGRMGEPNWAMH